ncbi:MAG: LacI family transcriptional regulator [Saccharospirillum sp.]|nr:LacI family transcriptional regulator [Saccharospirillum sp.]
MDRNTIHEAARRANVSVASISRALNNKPGLGEATRARILAVCAELGYSPSVAARQLKEGRTATVGLSLGLHDWQVNPYVSIMFEHLTRHLHYRGLMPVLFHHSNIPQLIEQTASAILLGVENEDRRIRALNEAGIPFVAIGKRHDGFWVCPDDEHGGQLAADRLIELGCRRLASVEIDNTEKGTALRASGFQQVCQEAGIESQSLNIPDSTTPTLTAYRYLTQHWSGSPFPYDGLFCETDEIAFGVRSALLDMGVDVPGQVKIIGYDDLPVFSEGITTIQQDISAIARAATELLIEALQGQKAKSRVMPVHLIRRDSA